MADSVKYYKLNYSQDTLFFAQKFCLFKQLNTVCTSYLLKMDFDEELLKKAIITAYEKHECLRIRLAKVNKQTVQYITDYKEPKIKIADFSNKTKEEENKFFEKVAHSKLTKIGKDVSKIYIVRSQNGYNGLSLAVSHLAMDSFAIFAFYKFIIDYYMHYKDGSPAPQDPASYTALLEKELKYEGSPQAARDDEFWGEFFNRPMPIYNDIRGTKLLEETRKQVKDPNVTYAKTFTFNSKSDHLILKYEKPLVDKLENYRRENGVSVQAIITTAMCTYLMAKNGTNDVTLFLTHARRATIAEKSAGGSRIHVFPYRQIFDKNDSFANAVVGAYNEQCAEMHHLNFNPTKIFDLYTKKYNAPAGTQFNAFSMTYQPIRIASPNNVDFKIMWYVNGAVSQPLYPTIMDGDGTGELHCHYEHQVAKYTDDEIATAHNGFVKVLEIAMQDPSLSINEIINKLS